MKRFFEIDVMRAQTSCVTVMIDDTDPKYADIVKNGKLSGRAMAMLKDIAAEAADETLHNSDWEEDEEIEINAVKQVSGEEAVQFVSWNGIDGRRLTKEDLVEDDPLYKPAPNQMDLLGDCDD